MKIALLGSASSSVMLAPFQNEAYREFVQGRLPSAAVAHGQVPGDWDIWGCSPGCWAVIPRATRWFEVHRWEPGAPWFSPEYCEFLRRFRGTVYTGGQIPEIPNHVVYPIDSIEAAYSSYFLTSSLAEMLAMAIYTIEAIRVARAIHREHREHAILSGKPLDYSVVAPPGTSMQQLQEELEKSDDGDMIGLWGVDMAATEEYSFQRPGCQFFILEAMRRGIGVYLPPESDLMRPMPVYGISEWDHNYIKLTSRARELNGRMQAAQGQLEQAKQQLTGIQGEMHALNNFVQTWTSPYGMQHGLVIRQTPGTGLGSGITHLDSRPVQRMTVAPSEATAVIRAIGKADQPTDFGTASTAAANDPAPTRKPARMKRSGAKAKRS